MSMLVSLSSELAGVVERIGPSVVRIDDGSNLTATGIIWSADGVIVTTSHGVERDDELQVELADGTVHAATLVGRDTDTDIAVLRVATEGLNAAPTADPEEVRVGNLVLALGRPGETGLQATIGIVSARLETETSGKPEFILHTDAVLYPGFSGGPLVGVDGRVVGLTNRMFGRGSGIALGIPLVKNVVETLLTQGRVQRGYLGVRTQLVTIPQAQRQTLSLAQERAVLIVQVESASPAEQGGLLLGDTILNVNGKPVEDVDGLRSSLRSLRAGDAVALRLLRGGAIQEINITLGVAE